METEQFLRQQKSSLLDTFKSSNFAPMLVYLADVFPHLNDLILSVQEKRVNIMTACDLCLQKEIVVVKSAYHAENLKDNTNPKVNNTKFCLFTKWTTSIR